MANEQLCAAKTAKNDEFYTQYSDIEAEMNAYVEYNKDVFRDKVILCPCDDPEWSNFTKYFATRFETLGLKRLICTSYAKSAGNKQISDYERKSPQFDETKHFECGKLFILDKDMNGSGRIDKDDIQWDYLEGDGDFRSEEVTRLRDEADFIITNPPFSLFREFLAWIMDGEKKFIIIGNLNTVANKEIFPLFKENMMWMGATCFKGGATYFAAPSELYDENKMSNSKHAYWKNGIFYWRVNGVRWYTNVEHGIRHEELQLMSMGDNLKYNRSLVKTLKNKYGTSEYPYYENYPALEVPSVYAIPDDYFGEMGVPVSFVDKYCPEQFEIIGIGIGELGKQLKITPIPKHIDESLPGHSSVWRLYIMNGEKAVVPYSRIIIKRKKENIEDV